MDMTKKDYHEFTENELTHYELELGNCIPLVMNHVVPFDESQFDNPSKNCWCPCH